MLLTLYLSLALGGEVSLSPKLWETGAIEAMRQMDQTAFDKPFLAESDTAMVVTTSFGGTAARAGLEAMKRGGNAVDAALATSFTQIALNLGSWSSYAGLFSMVYYEAATGKVYSVEGGWHIPLEATDPMTMPPIKDGHVARGILVPGFMAAAGSAHKRFGKLPWATLWDPAVYFAEEGVPFNPMHAFFIDKRKDVLQRYPETWAIFHKPDGRAYQYGETFKQTALAHTLRNVAQHGPAYMYTGAWGQEMVRRVRAAGGNISMKDLQRYKPVWTEPVRGQYRGYEIVGCGFPNMGGIHMVEALHMMEQGGLPKATPYWQDAAQLKDMIQVSRMAALLTLGPQRYNFQPEKVIAPGDYSPAGRLTRATSDAMWQRISQPDWPAHLRKALPRSPEAGSHSDSVVVCDPQGNMVSIVHSINARLWGESGIFVGGIAVSDGGRAQKPSIKKAGPGNRLPELTNPLIILKDGKPVLGSGAVGRGLHEVTFQSLVNVLAYDMDPMAAVQAPKFQTPVYNPTSPTADNYHQQRLIDRGYSAAVLARLKQLGQDYVLQKPEDLSLVGYWAGLKRDPKTGKLQGSGNNGVGAQGY